MSSSNVSDGVNPPPAQAASEPSSNGHAVGGEPQPEVKPGAYSASGGSPEAKKSTRGKLGIFGGSSTRSLGEARSSGRAKLADIRSWSGRSLRNEEKEEKAEVSTPSVISAEVQPAANIRSFGSNHSLSEEKAKRVSMSERLGAFRASRSSRSPMKAAPGSQKRADASVLDGDVFGNTDSPDSPKGLRPVKSQPSLSHGRPGALSESGKGNTKRDAITRPGSKKAALARLEPGQFGKNARSRSVGAKRGQRLSMSELEAGVMNSTSTPQMQANSTFAVAAAGKGSMRKISSFADSEEQAQITAPTSPSGNYAAVQPGAVRASGGTREGKPARTSRADAKPGAVRSRSAVRNRKGDILRDILSGSLHGERVEQAEVAPAATAAGSFADMKPGAVRASGGTREGKPSRESRSVERGASIPTGSARLEQAEVATAATAAGSFADVKPGAVRASGGTREGKPARASRVDAKQGPVRSTTAATAASNLADVKPGAVRATGGMREGKPARASRAEARPGAVRSRSPTRESKGGMSRGSFHRERVEQAEVATSATAASAACNFADARPGAVRATGGTREGKPARVSRAGMGPRAGRSMSPNRDSNRHLADMKPGAVRASGGMREGKSTRASRAEMGPAAGRSMSPTRDRNGINGSSVAREDQAEVKPGAVRAYGGAKVLKGSGSSRARPGAVSSTGPLPSKRSSPSEVLPTGSIKPSVDVEEQAKVTVPTNTDMAGRAHLTIPSVISTSGHDAKQRGISKFGSSRSLNSNSTKSFIEESEETDLTASSVPIPPGDAAETTPGAISQQYSEYAMDSKAKDYANEKAGTFARLPMVDATLKDHAVETARMGAHALPMADAPSKDHGDEKAGTGAYALAGAPEFASPLGPGRPGMSDTIEKDKANAKGATYAQLPPEDDSPFLIEAKIVDESARISVYLAEEAQEEDSNPKRTKWMVGGILCIVAVAVAIVLSVVLTYDFGSETAYPVWEDDDKDYARLQEECLANNTDSCEANCAGIHGIDQYLADKCCAYAGRTASILAFEEDSQWVPRLEEFYKCTGGRIRLEYLPEGEDGMANALRNDLGDDASHDQGNAAGQGLFDAYIVQAPWLWPVVNGLENLTPRIRENADTVKFLDINPASRSAVSYNGTVRALPLDTDYIALGWRQDVFYKYNVSSERSPPRTIEDLASLAEELNGLDFNDDGEPDWGVCLTPQVNYFYAFVAPMMQTSLRDPVDGTPTGQNMFFSADTFEPLIHQPAFKTAVEIYYKIIRNSNCGEQLSKGEKCDRKSAFPTGRCAMVISMPGTLTKMLLDGAKYAPAPRTNETTGEVIWDINNMPLGTGGGSYWGRRAPFPGSTTVQKWDTEAGYPLVDCSSEEGQSCPLADQNGINFAPFFAEGGEAYALNGRQSSPAAKAVMWDLFTWLSELPASELPLSGQYRMSHLNEEHRQELTEQAGWPNQMVDDIFNVLGQYFKSEENGGNPVQDLLMLGFPEYMGALDEELHDKFLGVKKASSGGVFNRMDPSFSIGPSFGGNDFDRAFEDFIESLEARYSAISASMSGGRMGQLQRWRSSLNLPWRTEEEICVAALSSNNVDSFNGLQCNFFVSFETLCSTQPDVVANLDDTLCESFKPESSKLFVIIPSIIIPLILLAVLGWYCYHEMKRREEETRWQIQLKELEFDSPPKVLGCGRFGAVVLAKCRGSGVAVKTIKLASSTSEMAAKGEDVPIKDLEAQDNTGAPTKEEVAQEVAPDMSDVSFEPTPKVSLGSSSSVSFEGKDSAGSLGLMDLKKTIMNRINGTEKEKFLKEVRTLSRLQGHRNIVSVVGAVIHGTNDPKLVLEHVEGGSLYDLLHSSERLGGERLLNILNDIAQGMRFLHSADPKVVHANLKSSNILISEEGRAKISDFGWGTSTPYWTAPEVLRREAPHTRESDIYSMGITMYEIYSRANPYEGEDTPTVLKQLKDPNVEKFPPCPATMSSIVKNMMNDCLACQPHHRPTVNELVARFGRFTTQDVEYQSTDSGGPQAMFPANVAAQLSKGQTVDMQTHECASVVLSEIVGFPDLFPELLPVKASDLLQRLNDCLDELAEQHRVFKVEMMGGGAWLGATNCVHHQPRYHVTRVARFAIEAVQAAATIPIDEEDPARGFVQLQTAFVSGRVHGKVVGVRTPRYSLSGPAVNAVQCLAGELSAPGMIVCTEVEQAILEKEAPDIVTEKKSAIPAAKTDAQFAFWVNPPKTFEEDKLEDLETEFTEDLQVLSKGLESAFEQWNGSKDGLESTTNQGEKDKVENADN